MSVVRQFKLALDETRMSILGAHILFGFNIQAAFHEGFEKLTPTLKAADAAGLLLMVLTLGLLLTPQAQHRIGERGEIAGRTRRTTDWCVILSLPPFAASLAIGIFIAVDQALGPAVAWTSAIALGLLAAAAWYAWGFLYRATAIRKEHSVKHGTSSKLEQKIDEMLTEARIALPGVQALLGFQLIVVLSNAFEKLPLASKEIHVAAMLLIAIAMGILITPAALHRIAFDGEDDERFFRIGSRLVIAALGPMALGIAGDVYVVIGKIFDLRLAGVAAAAAVIAVLCVLWFVFPLTCRFGWRRNGKSSTTSLATER